MHKILIVLNAMMKNNSSWKPQITEQLIPHSADTQMKYKKNINRDWERSKVANYPESRAANKYN